MDTSSENSTVALGVDSKQNRTSVEIAFSYTPLLVDAVTRWLVLAGWMQGYLPTAGFLFLQCVIIPIFVAGAFVAPRDEALKRKYKVETIVVKGTSFSVLFAFTLVVVGVIVVHQISVGVHIALRALLTLATISIYGFYVMAIYAISVGTSPPRTKRQLTPDNMLDPALLSRVDKNDLQIVRMETEVQSITQRIEAYTLESTLFGALAFSGFLTLISSERPVMEGMQQLIASSQKWWVLLRSGKSPGITVNLNQELSIIAVGTLLCSMFFLAVVLSRLRFYSMLHQVQYAVQAARAWNNKEEEVVNIRLSGTTNHADERLNQLSEMVAGAITHAEPLIQDLVGIARYMSVFRNIGVLTFLFVLFTSAFAISPNLGVIFLAIAGVAFLYSSFDHWLRHRRLRGIPFFLTISTRTHHGGEPAD